MPLFSHSHYWWYSLHVRKARHWYLPIILVAPGNKNEATTFLYHSRYFLSDFLVDVHLFCSQMISFLVMGYGHTPLLVMQPCLSKVGRRPPVSTQKHRRAQSAIRFLASLLFVDCLLFTEFSHQLKSHMESPGARTVGTAMVMQPKKNAKETPTVTVPAAEKLGHRRRKHGTRSEERRNVHRSHLRKRKSKSFAPNTSEEQMRERGCTGGN